MNKLDSDLKIKRNKHVSNGAIVLTKEYKRQLFFNKLFQFILFIILMIFIAIIGYISYYAPIKTSDGYLIPDKTRIKTDNIPTGTVVITTEKTDNIGSRLTEALVTPSQLIYGEIIAGPYGILIGEDGNYTVENEEGSVKAQTNLTLSNKHETKLNDEYIIRCTSGDCVSGQDYLVKNSQIKGALPLER